MNFVTFIGKNSIQLQN